MTDAWPERPWFCHLTAILFFLAATPAAMAAPDPAELCERATTEAAEQTGVPLMVLQAIALAESGRTEAGRHRPWPWTANFGGEGHWYGSQGEAELAVEERRALGATNIDIGCFQINYRWHGDAFSNIAAMFDPKANALYAAQFLARLHQETGTWPDAAAAYHSRTPEYADRYRARFERLANGLPDGDPTQTVALLKENRFPLLQRGSAGLLGSLVPPLSGGPSLLGGAP